ncbi:MAG: SpoIVB peptidase S55 domain-containing protein [Phycisphaerae bacterium]|nr:SpoIVB peptidase S55 domain-containing protein [Phycisphaerae bacterium]MDD5380046.1 SpoIVB peptidase S55 domain-containing protein [Phycisphaerae bacterium]
MFRIFAKPKAGFFLFSLLVLLCSFCLAREQPDKPKPQNTVEGSWDPTKYISVDEIRPGMEAYCLTVYKGAEIEKFGLEVLSVVRDVEPGKDAILVQGTDERFIHSGPVWGCSGSPVYIDGRMAGALAYSYFFSKDPLYRVTPIREILRAGYQRNPAGKPRAAGAARDIREPAFTFDFSRPIDFAEINRQITTSRLPAKNSRGGLTSLVCPLVTSGLPAEVCEQLNASIEPFGLAAVSGVSGAGTSNAVKNVWQPNDVKLAPGACLAVPLVSGDITMAAIGTVTEVSGDKVYAFGHGFLDIGEIDLPMATGQVHTIASSVMRSFKFASPIEIVGALTTDESTTVCGRIGAQAKTIPLVITVDRYNDAKKRVYNCRIADNQLLTPLVLRSAVAGAVLMVGSLPPDHTVEYKVVIDVDGTAPVVFENVSTGAGLEEILEEGIGSVTVLLNNPYKKVDIKSINFDIRIVPKNVTSRIWSVNLSASRVKAGQDLDVSVVVESFLAEKKEYRRTLKIPRDLAPGKYDLIVCGGRGYQEFLMKTAPYKFIPQNMDTLVEAMNNLLTIGRDKLYCLLVLPAAGIAVEGAELPDLPATKVLLMQDVKRTLRSQPHPRWLEESLATGTVIIDEKVMQITVEE